MTQNSTPSRRQWFILAVVLMGLFAIQVFATHRFLINASSIGFNDFFSRWRGANIYLMEGRDPYGLDVTDQIQVEMGATHQARGRSGFHYPLHVMFTFLPLVYVPYGWAQAIWFNVLLWITVAIVGVMLRYLGWKPSPMGIMGLFFSGIFLYPVARTMLLGQFTLHVTLFLALSLLMLKRGNDGWAGIFLAATSIKPQIIIAAGIWLVIWTLLQKRYRFLWGVLGGGLGLFLAATAVFPRWIISFIEDMTRYADVAGGRNPLLVLTELLGLGETQWLRYLLSAILLSMMLYAWWRARHADGLLFDLAVYWSILIMTLIPFQTGTTGQAQLLLPLIAGIYYAVRTWGGWKTAVFVALVWSSFWLLFITTISGDYENQIMFLAAPAVVLVGLCLAEWKLYRQPEQLLL